MAGRSSSSSGGGFVDSVSVGSAVSSRPSGGAPRRRGRSAIDDTEPGGPVTVTVIDRDEVPRMTLAGRFRVG